MARPGWAQVLAGHVGRAGRGVCIAARRGCLVALRRCQVQSAIHEPEVQLWLITTARVLASQAEAIVRTGKTWPQATKGGRRLNGGTKHRTDIH